VEFLRHKQLLPAFAVPNGVALMHERPEGKSTQRRVVYSLLELCWSREKRFANTCSTHCQRVVCDRASAHSCEILGSQVSFCDAITSHMDPLQRSSGQCKKTQYE
jgi:hypothetical protein